MSFYKLNIHLMCFSLQVLLLCGCVHRINVSPAKSSAPMAEKIQVSVYKSDDNSLVDSFVGSKTITFYSSVPQKLLVRMEPLDQEFSECLKRKTDTIYPVWDYHDSHDPHSVSGFGVAFALILGNFDDYLSSNQSRRQGGSWHYYDYVYSINLDNSPKCRDWLMSAEQEPNR